MDFFIKKVRGGLPVSAIYFKGIRRRQGLSQVQAARMLGISQSTVSNIETGRRIINHRLADKIVELFEAESALLTSDS